MCFKEQPMAPCGYPAKGVYEYRQCQNARQLNKWCNMLFPADPVTVPGGRDVDFCCGYFPNCCPWTGGRLREEYEIAKRKHDRLFGLDPRLPPAYYDMRMYWNEWTEERDIMVIARLNVPLLREERRTRLDLPPIWVGCDIL